MSVGLERLCCTERDTVLSYFRNLPNIWVETCVANLLERRPKLAWAKLLHQHQSADGPTASETHILGTEEFNENFCCGEQWGLTGNPACWNEEPPVGVDRETYRTDLSDVDIAFEADSACNVTQIWMRSSST